MLAMHSYILQLHTIKSTSHGSIKNENAKKAATTLSFCSREDHSILIKSAKFQMSEVNSQVDLMPAKVSSNGTLYKTLTACIPLLLTY